MVLANVGCGRHVIFDCSRVSGPSAKFEQSWGFLPQAPRLIGAGKLRTRLTLVEGTDSRIVQIQDSTTRLNQLAVNL